MSYITISGKKFFSKNYFFFNQQYACSPSFSYLAYYTLLFYRGQVRKTEDENFEHKDKKKILRGNRIIRFFWVVWFFFLGSYVYSIKHQVNLLKSTLVEVKKDIKMCSLERDDGIRLFALHKWEHEKEVKVLEK